MRTALAHEARGIPENASEKSEREEDTIPIRIENIVEPVRPQGLEAYNLLLPELMAVPQARLPVHNTLDVGLAGQNVLGNLRDLARIEDDVIAVFGESWRAEFRALPATAAAAIHAHVQHVYPDRPFDLTELSKQVAEQHAMLFTDAMSLVYRGFLDRGEVEQYKAGVGYKALYESLLGLVALFRSRHAIITGNTPITTEMVDAAEKFGSEMSDQLGKRAQEDERNSAAEMRLRALTVLVDRYEQIRRMVNYVCWFTGDADVYAPSLWTAARRAASTNKKEDGGEYPPEPSTPTPSPVVTGDPTDDGKDVDPSDPFVS